MVRLNTALTKPIETFVNLCFGRVLWRFDTSCTTRRSFTHRMVASAFNYFVASFHGWYIPSGALYGLFHGPKDHFAGFYEGRLAGDKFEIIAECPEFVSLKNLTVQFLSDSNGGFVVKSVTDNLAEVSRLIQLSSDTWDPLPPKRERVLNFPM
jgi:hypothetical protein